LDNLFLLETLPFSNEFVLDVIPRYWHLRETLHQGNIPKRELTFTESHEVFNDLENYILKEQWKVDVLEVPEWDVGFNNDLENWLKFVWLTKEYLSKGFINPVCVHYNPRIRKNVIHPGGCRQQVLNLFHNNSIHAIYFNTGGVRPKWLKKMKKVSVESLIAQGWGINLVADHGSLIPHLLKDLDSIVVGKKQTQIMIQKNLSNFKFTCNRKIDILSPWQTKDRRKARFKCNIIRGNFEENIVKAAACMFNNIEYSDREIEVLKR